MKIKDFAKSILIPTIIVFTMTNCVGQIENPAGDISAYGQNLDQVSNYALWADVFMPGVEVKLTGDFNGDGRTDVVGFRRRGYGDVNVALSDGRGAFVDESRWHDQLCLYDDEICLVGDFNGDGRDDIASVFPTGMVRIATSGGDMFYIPRIWHYSIGRLGQRFAVGDVNGDGLDDLVAFAGNSQAYETPTAANGFDNGRYGDVHVVLAQRGEFGLAHKWHDGFCARPEQDCFVGDVDGDRKADLVAMSDADTRWSRSDGNSFGPDIVWDRQVPAINRRAQDIDGDGDTDFVFFHVDGTVSAAFWSDGQLGTVSGGVLLADTYCLNPNGCQLGDVDADGDADIIDIVFETDDWRARNDIWVSISSLAVDDSHDFPDDFAPPEREEPAEDEDTKDTFPSRDILPATKTR